jgi:hypothetical protein
MLAFSKIEQQAVGKRLYLLKPTSAYRFLHFCNMARTPKVGRNYSSFEGAMKRLLRNKADFLI